MKHIIKWMLKSKRLLVFNVLSITVFLVIYIFLTSVYSNSLLNEKFQSLDGLSGSIIGIEQNRETRISSNDLLIIKEYFGSNNVSVIDRDSISTYVGNYSIEIWITDFICV